KSLRSGDTAVAWMIGKLLTASWLMSEPSVDAKLRSSFTKNSALNTYFTFGAFIASALDLSSRFAFSSTEMLHGSMVNSDFQLAVCCDAVGTTLTPVSRACA